MISKYALFLANHFADMDVYGKERINVYKYGFELLISTVFNMMGMLLTSIIMGVISRAVLFCVAFVPLRLAAGGYHAKHHWSCIIGFNAVFLGFAVLHRYISIKYALPYSLAAASISAILIWFLAPVEAVNKPLRLEQKKRQKNRSLLIAGVNMAVTLSFFAVERTNNFLPLLAFYNSGSFAASVSLAVAIAVRKKASPTISVSD